MAATAETNLELRGVIYPEGAQWFGHCLELDIVAEGASPDEALSDLLDLCRSQIETAIENNDLESIFRPAPAKYWSLFFSSKRKRRAPPRANFSPLKNFDAREMVLA